MMQCLKRFTTSLGKRTSSKAMGTTISSFGIRPGNTGKIRSKNQCRTSSIIYIHRFQGSPFGRSLSLLIENRRYNFSTLSVSTDHDLDLEDRTGALLRHIYDSTEESFTLMHYDRVMEEWSKQCSLYAAEKAEMLLRALEKNQDESHAKHLVPNAISYNHVLQAYVLSNGGSKSCFKCSEILDQMLQRCRHFPLNNNASERDLPPEPLVTTFNTVMNSWAKSHDYNAGIKAEEIYRKMEHWNYECQTKQVNQRYSGVEPNTRSLAIVIDAWANSGHHDSSDRIVAIYEHALEKLFGIVENEHHQIMAHHGAKAVPLNTVFFNSVLNALANSKGGIQAAEKAHEIFNTMQELSKNGKLQRAIEMNRGPFENESDVEISPNIRTWTLLIKCWANAGEVAGRNGAEYAASNAESILKEMEECYEAGQDVKPNSYAFASCIKAWAECSSEIGAIHALSILDRMERLFQDTQDKDLQPTYVHYNTCLSALCKVKSEECLKRAKLLLERMCVNGAADTVSYNTLMMGYLNHDPNVAVENVEALVNEMESKNIPPDSSTFNIMMDAWRKCGRSRAVDKVITVLHQMMDLSKKSTNISPPTTASFTLVLNTISSSDLDEKVEPARKIFHEMLSLYEHSGDDTIKPDTRVFSAFISVCANQGGPHDRKRAALKLALHTYEHLCKNPGYGIPNSYVYGNLMKAVGRLCSDHDEKTRLLEHIFKKCVDEGQLSRITWNVFLKGASRMLKDKLVGNAKEIPPEWSRNVRRQDRP